MEQPVPTRIEYLMLGQLQPEADFSNAIWYLGIDFGTTGMSAVLSNSSTGQQYPIYWSNEFPSTTRSSGKEMFRLPAATYSGPATSKLSVRSPTTIDVVGLLASKLASNQPGIVLQNFKPYLQLAIPYYCPKRREWEPTLQLPDGQQVSLYWVRRALQALLETLTPKNAVPDAAVEVRAIGLDAVTLATALQQLEGVILGCPVGWGETYRFNLREAVLEAKLVKTQEQIFFLEDAIAPILAGLLGTGVSWAEEAGEVKKKSSPHPLPTSPPPNLTPSSQPCQGGILVINSGAIATELALVDLPDDLQELTYDDFTAYSLPYGGNAIDLDVFCQLLYPQLSERQHQQLSLGNELELPLPGQPDRLRRDRLTLLLQRSPLGQALLKACGYLKLILQHKDEFTLELGSDRWTVKRQDLEAHVILPFIQLLDRVLNELSIRTGIAPQGIYQVLCIGGTASWQALETWIQQKLPFATLMRDADRPTGNSVAAGLAALPLYPNVLNRTQQQYSDYFLLLELLRAFSETPDRSTDHSYSLKEIMQILEYRGLNPSACYKRLVRLVEGELPLGLVPSVDEDSLLSRASKQKQASMLAASPQLFFKEGDRYRPNLQQHEGLRRYLDIVLSATHQKFEEPLIVKLGTNNR